MHSTTPLLPLLLSTLWEGAQAEPTTTVQIHLTQVLTAFETVWQPTASSASLTANGTGLTDTRSSTQLPSGLFITTRDWYGEPYFTETLTSKTASDTYGYSGPTWSEPGSEPSTTSAARELKLGTITLTAGGAPQTMSGVAYSLDECHLYVGMATETLGNGGTECKPTSTVKQQSSSRALPAVVTSFASRPSAYPTQATVGSSNTTSNGTDQSAVLGAPLTGARSSTTQSRLPWTTTTTVAIARGSQTSSATQTSSNESSASSERRAVESLVWLMVGLLAVCCV